MILNHICFGEGKKNFILLPGVSFRPVSLFAEDIEKAYSIFASDYKVYVFDYNDNIDENYTIDDMCDDLIETLEYLNLKDNYIEGVSLGGMLGLKLLGKRSDLIKKLVLVSMALKGNTKTIKNWLELINEKNIKELIDCYTRNVYSKEYYNKYKDLIYDMYKDLNDEELYRLKIRTRIIYEFDIEKQFIKNDIPILFIGTKNDKIFEYNDMKHSVDVLDCDYYFYEEYCHAVYDEAEDIKDRVYNYLIK